MRYKSYAMLSYFQDFIFHSSAEGSTKPKVGVKAASLVPPHLTERQQLALLLKQTRTESLPVQSEESDSDQSDVSSSSSSGGNNRKKRRAGFWGGEKRHKKIDDQKAESNRKEDSKTEEKEGGSEDEGAPSGGFTHSARLPPPIPMPRGMGKRTRVRQRRTGAGETVCLRLSCFQQAFILSLF